MSLPNIRVYIKPDAAFKPSGNAVLGTSLLGAGFLLGPPSEAFKELTPITSVSIRRGRTRATDSFDAGSASVTFVDTTGTFNPDNTSSILYVGGVSYIKPLRQFKITTVIEGSEYFLFSGYVTDFKYDYSQGVNAVQVTISAVDPFRVLTLGNVETITGATYNELSSARISKILNQASIPTGVQNILVGDTYVTDDPDTVRSGLEAVQQVEHTEMGAFFVDRNGKFTFYGRKYLQQLAAGYAKTPLVFGETSGLPFEKITQTFDDENITNDITINGPDILDVQKTDATSILDYSSRSTVLSGLLLVNDAEAENLANYLLNSRKDPQLVISGIEVSPMSLSDANLVTVVTCDLLEPITLTKKYSGSAIDLTRTLTVQSIDHDIRPGSWSMKFGLAEPIGGDALVLDYGKLDVNTLGY